MGRSGKFKSEAKEILEELERRKSEENIEGKKRFGIISEHMYGIRIPELRELAKYYRFNHDLALELWKTKVHECMIMASYIDHPKEVTLLQREEWVRDFRSWDICDQVCGNLFDRTPFAFVKAEEWVKREEEFIKRAGFVLMATLSVHAKSRNEEDFFPFFDLIAEYGNDDRNFVKKAVNWAIRQMGKRSLVLHKKALEVSGALATQGKTAGKWIASDALRELNSERVLKKFKH